MMVSVYEKIGDYPVVPGEVAYISIGRNPVSLVRSVKEKTIKADEK